GLTSVRSRSCSVWKCPRPLVNLTRDRCAQVIHNDETSSTVLRFGLSACCVPEEPPRPGLGLNVLIRRQVSLPDTQDTVLPDTRNEILWDSSREGRAPVFRFNSSAS
ncbi:unnamed protein product, partial [Ascophyllum nodosum]